MRITPPLASATLAARSGRAPFDGRLWFEKR